MEKKPSQSAAMSLFGTSPRADGETTTAGWTPTRARSGGGGLFDDDDNDSSNGHGSTPRVKASNMKNGAGLFDDASSSPWDMPTPRKKPSRAAVLQSLLPVSAVPESYVVAFDEAVRGGRSVANDGVAQVFAAARLGPEAQKRIVSLVSADDDGGDGGDSLRLGRNEFNVLLALVGLAQEGEVISLDGVDERRRSTSFSSHPLPYLCLSCPFVHVVYLSLLSAPSHLSHPPRHPSMPYLAYPPSCL